MAENLGLVALGTTYLRYFSLNSVRVIRFTLQNFDAMSFKSLLPPQFSSNSTKVYEDIAHHGAIQTYFPWQSAKFYTFCGSLKF